MHLKKFLFSFILFSIDKFDKQFTILNQFKANVIQK
jgi:hypothetical protein